MTISSLDLARLEAMTISSLNLARLALSALRHPDTTMRELACEAIDTFLSQCGYMETHGDDQRLTSYHTDSGDITVPKGFIVWALRAPELFNTSQERAYMVLPLGSHPIGRSITALTNCQYCHGAGNVSGKDCSCLMKLTR